MVLSTEILYKNKKKTAFYLTDIFQRNQNISFSTMTKPETSI